PTWHGHKVPVQPFPPPGGFAIGPTGPGYYTTLQMLRDEMAEKPPRWPYQRNGGVMMPVFEYDFSYLDSVPPPDPDWAEMLKRIPVGDHMLFSTGGEMRFRYDNETNSQLTGKKDTYGNVRLRSYVDVWYEDVLRLYGEALYGDIWGNELAPLTRDVN